MWMVACLTILQLHSAMLGMGHGKLKPRPRFEELSMLRAQLKSNNDDYDNMMIAEYTPLRITTHAPRFKIIDNQQQARNPLAANTRWKKKKKRGEVTYDPEITKDDGIQKNWRLELPDATKARKNDTWQLDSPDYEATRAHKNPEDQNTLRTWKPDANVDNSIQKIEHQNSSSLSSDSNDTDINYSESSIEATRSLIKEITDLPIFDPEFEATRVRKDPDYIHTWRTWEPEDRNEDNSVSKKPVDSAGNDSETNEATEVSEKYTEFENTLHIGSGDSEISKADALNKKAVQVTLAADKAEVSNVTRNLNELTYSHPWRTWQHFPKTNRSATRSPGNSKSADTKATKLSTKDYEELNKYWQLSKEREKRYKTTSTMYKGGKPYDMHLRIGSEESDFSGKTNDF